MSLDPFLKSEKDLNALECIDIFWPNLKDYIKSAKINANVLVED